MSPTKHRFTSVDQYIRTFPQDVRAILEKVRKTVRAAAPKAEEGISYRMPAVKFHGKTVVCFAAFKKHIGFYPPAPKAFQKEVARYAGPKGNLQFPLDEPMPLGLVEKMVKYKVNEILEKQKGTRTTCSRGHDFVKSTTRPVCPKCWPGRYRTSPKAR